MEDVITAILDKAERERAAKAAIAERSPEGAAAIGSIYTGDNLPDKGQRDGSCNRTHCQLPLKGKSQWVIVGGDFHYCEKCADKFREVDRSNNRPFRCYRVV